METRTVTVRRLARELGIDRQKISKYLNRHPKLKLGKREGTRGLLTEAEADQVRVTLGKKLVLPTPEQVAEMLGEPVYPTAHVVRELGLCVETVINYARDLGVLHEIRNGLMPSFVIPASGVTKIWEARESTKERLKAMLRAQAKDANRKGTRMSQHRALMREDLDYHGKVVAFEIVPSIVEDPELSSETGPQTCTLQWRPFYPATELNAELDNSVWNVSDHREHLSLDSMKDRKGQYHAFNGNGRQKHPL